jgi:hypothetical protein
VSEQHTHYWQYGEQDKATRRKFNTGDIFENAAECLECGEYIRSNNRHDFKYCKCGNVAVDGGSWYAKRSYKTDKYRNIVVLFKDAE